MLVVVGVAVAGLALAAAVALSQWWADDGAYPHVARLDPPPAAAPRR